MGNGGVLHGPHLDKFSDFLLYHKMIWKLISKTLLFSCFLLICLWKFRQCVDSIKDIRLMSTVEDESNAFLEKIGAANSNLMAELIDKDSSIY